MSPGGGDTRSGRIREQVIRPVLGAGAFRAQVAVGTKLTGEPYLADFVVYEASDSILISAKWQQTKGTAEEKILWDIANLIAIVRSSTAYRKAYVVLGGSGFSNGMRSFLVRQGHRDVLQDGHLVEVVSLEDFLARANQGRL